MKLAQPLLRRKLKKRAQAEPLYGQFIEERFGHYSQPQHENWIWIHAVSLGETRTAGILLAHLRASLPGMKLLLTHGTATGREEGLKLLQAGDIQVWQPWDAPDIVRRFFKAFQPRMGLIMETEVWPCWVHQAKKHHVPLYLINARMSEKSMHKAMQWPSLMGPAFAGLKAVLAQTPDDAQRFEKLGAIVSGIVGNIKFDAQADALQMATAKRWKANQTKPIVMLASSREGEEELWLDALQANVQHMLSPSNDPIQCLIVPRHPQRVAAVAQLIESRGIAVSRRSTWGPDGPVVVQGPCIYVGDSMGEMSLYYGLADAALLGGSFEPLGGQNLIEAAACGCPVFMGPHTFNFAQAALSAEVSGAAVRASNMVEAMTAATRMVLNPQLQNLHSEKAVKFAAQHRGAAKRTTLAVQAWLAEIKASAAH
jgi:3-deoxy-D-manno-octulosonic-acid transferase